MTNNPVLAFGSFRRSERVDLGVLAQEAALELRLTDSSGEVAQWLEKFTPRAVLVEDDAAEAAAVCQLARAHPDRALVPIISIARELDDLSFGEVFSWGGDDAVELTSIRPLLSRLRALPSELRAPPPSSRGLAVVADPDRDRRLVRARVLRNAGYTVQFAVTAQDALRFQDMDNVQLVVIDTELEDAESVLSSSPVHQKRFVVLCPPKQMAGYAERFHGAHNVAISDSFAPPENVLFIANELLRGGAGDKRSSRRLLYGTKVAFRGEGRDGDDFGFCYNISAGGLYVRTLAPPADDQVWIELRPPRTDRKVRLEGQVVWRRGFGPAEHATVPPGFGFKLTDATRKNLQTWLDGYNSFCRSLGLSETPELSTT
jgi:DNA-binding response OmpR family regulator